MMVNYTHGMERMSTIWCKVTEWKKGKKLGRYSGTAKPEDPALFAVFQYVLITEEMLKRSGHKGVELKKGDRIEIDVIVYAYRCFEHEHKPEKVDALRKSDS